MIDLNLAELDKLEQTVWDSNCARCTHSHIVHERKTREKNLSSPPSGKYNPKGYITRLGGKASTQPDCKCPAFIDKLAVVRNQLRPLLELVDRMGEALTAGVAYIDATSPTVRRPPWAFDARDVLDDYRRAKGGE